MTSEAVATDPTVPPHPPPLRDDAEGADGLLRRDVNEDAGCAVVDEERA